MSDLTPKEKAIAELFASAMGRRGEWPKAKVLTEEEVAERLQILAEKDDGEVSEA